MDLPENVIPVDFIFHKANQCFYQYPAVRQVHSIYFTLLNLTGISLCQSFFFFFLIYTELF